MSELGNNNVFTVSEMVSLEQLKADIASGARSEEIAGYQPSEENYPLLAMIGLAYQVPALLEIAAEEEPLDPIERIKELVEQLDKKILSAPEKDRDRSISDVFEGRQVRSQAEDGSSITLYRAILPVRTTAIKVEKTITPPGDKPDKCTHLAAEQFFLSNEGLFSRIHTEKYSSEDEWQEVEVAGFYSWSPQFSKEAAESLAYFEELVAPFLSD